MDAVGRRLAERFVGGQLGRTLTVLVEKRRKSGVFSGWSDNYIDVELGPTPAGEEPSEGAFIKARLSRRVGHRKASGAAIPPMIRPDTSKTSSRILRHREANHSTTSTFDKTRLVR